MRFYFQLELLDLVPKHVELIALSLGINESSVRNTMELLEEGATIPFIARYRKERTGSLDEVQVSDIQKQAKKLEELELRKESILASIEEQGKLTPELKAKIQASYSSNEIEDLYLPFKRKRKTKADVARESGLEPFAKIIMAQRGADIQNIAKKYLNDKVATVDEAISGAKDIIAEWISEDQDIRERLRVNFRRFATINSKVVPKKKEEAEKYQDYFDFQEALSKCPSHRFLAMMRGDSESMLKISLSIDDIRALEMIDRKFIRSNGAEADIIQ